MGFAALKIENLIRHEEIDHHTYRRPRRLGHHRTVGHRRQQQTRHQRGERHQGLEPGGERLPTPYGPHPAAGEHREGCRQL